MFHHTRMVTIPLTPRAIKIFELLWPNLLRAAQLSNAEPTLASANKLDRLGSLIGTEASSLKLGDKQEFEQLIHANPWEILGESIRHSRLITPRLRCQVIR